MTTPLIVKARARSLSHHPDKAFARCLLRPASGSASPTPYGYNRPQSTWGLPASTPEYLAKELTLGRMLGPFDTSIQLPRLHVNQFGVIPKGHNTGRYRLITNLWFPQGHSVNDGINPGLCSLTYSTVDKVADLVAVLGCGAMLAKVDNEFGYRLPNAAVWAPPVST